MITDQTTNDLIESLASIQSKFNDLVDRSNQLEAKIKDLERQGIERGSVYMRKNGYMYLIYPMKDTKRERKYIGPDVNKQQSVREALSRAVEYDKLVSEFHETNQLLFSSLTTLNHCKEILDCNS